MSLHLYICCTICHPNTLYTAIHDLWIFWKTWIENGLGLTRILVKGRALCNSVMENSTSFLWSCLSDMLLYVSAISILHHRISNKKSVHNAALTEGLDCNPSKIKDTLFFCVWGSAAHFSCSAAFRTNTPMDLCAKIYFAPQKYQTRKAYHLSYLLR